MLSNNDTIRFRMKWMAFLLIPLAAALIVRLYIIQVRDHQEYLDKARARYTTTRVTSGKRGEIFDVSGNLLVSNIPCVHIIADPMNLRNPKKPEDQTKRRKLAFLLATTFDESFQEFYEKLAPMRPRRNKEGKVVPDEKGEVELLPSRYAPIARNVPLDIADRLKAQLKVNRINNVLTFKDGYMRTYPKGRMLANVLGYTNVVQESDIAQIGLEKFYDRQMTAAAGTERYERDRTGRPLFYGMHESQESRDGKDVYLTISEPIQSILEEELDAAYAKWNPATLYAAIADPKTGNILAIAQRPNFDPNIRSTFKPEAARTRIAEDGIEPGSIIKPFTVGKALDWGFVKPDTVIDCENGRWIYLKRALTDSHEYDKLTVAGVIQKSSNIGTAKIALLLGEERIYRLLRSFGFGQKTGLPFPLETAGLLPPVKRWDGLSITRFPIGYGVRVSPLQMLRAYCALANHGFLPTLRLVDRVVDPATGNSVKVKTPPPVQMFEHPQAHRQLIEMMIQVTEPGGTAVKAAIPGYQVAGKTGTSRKYIPGQGYAARKYFSSFVGFVPAHDPAFVLLITFDEPKGAYYGSTVPAPVFHKVAERVLRHLNIQPDPALLPQKKR